MLGCCLRRDRRFQSLEKLVAWVTMRTLLSPLPIPCSIHSELLDGVEEFLPVCGSRQFDECSAVRVFVSKTGFTVLNTTQSKY